MIKSFSTLVWSLFLSCSAANATVCTQVTDEVNQKVIEVCDTSKNTFNNSFSKAKKYLEREVYNDELLSRNTLYCGCTYSEKKIVDNSSCWFEHNKKYIKRSKKIEWEHVVPAQAFGKSFEAWTLGDRDCVNSKWKKFKGRKCASKVEKEYQFMEYDMYNLFPAIGSINALRSNYAFEIIEWEDREFWECDMEIGNKRAEPTESIRGDIARIYFYMEISYPWRLVISDVRMKILEAWSLQDPVSEEECERYKAIKKIHKNENVILMKECKNNELK